MAGQSLEFASPSRLQDSGCNVLYYISMVIYLDMRFNTPSIHAIDKQLRRNHMPQSHQITSCAAFHHTTYISGYHFHTIQHLDVVSELEDHKDQYVLDIVVRSTTQITQTVPTWNSEPRPNREYGRRD